jgi:hypothetical protein
MPDVLPYAHASWDEYVATGDDEFRAYNLRRLNPRTGAYEVIAVIDELATTDWHDYLAFPGPNTYRLTVTVDRLDALIESDPVEVPDVVFSWRGLWLHEVRDPDRQLYLRASTLDHRVQQGQTWRLAPGRREETLFAGPLLSRRLELDLIPEDLRDPSVIDALERFLARQYDADAVLCVRWGARPGARYIVQVDVGIEESIAGGLGHPRLPLRQVAMPRGWA